MSLDPRTGRGLVISALGSLVGSGILIGITALVGAAHNTVNLILFAVILVCLLTIVRLTFLLRARSIVAREAQDLRDRLETSQGERAALKAEVDVLEKWRGLEEVTGLESFREALGASEMHPQEAIDKIHVSLDFMGHGASKWSAQSDQMHSMLRRLTDRDAEVGRARMLILDPESGECQQSSKVRFPDDPDALPRKIVCSLLELERLEKVHKNLHLRLYSHRPAFRITIIDHSFVVAGHYRNYQRGSEATPLLVIKADPDWSFYSPFQVLFNAEWRAAERVDWPKVHALAAKLGVSS